MSGKGINPNNAPAIVLIKKTSAKATPASGGERFNAAMNAAGGSLIAGVESAAGFFPGVGALSAAIRGARAGSGNEGLGGGIINAGFTGGGGGGMVSAGAGNNYGYGDGTVIAKGTSNLGRGDGTGTSLDAGGTGAPGSIEALASNAESLLQQQIAIQQVSNKYTALSNIMKSDHETKRGVIRNMA